MKIGLVIYFYLPYYNAPSDNDAHMYVMFNGTDALLSILVIFIITYDGAFKH
jgi:hypothetical protein